MSQAKSSRGAKAAKPAKPAKSARSSASRATPVARGGRGGYGQQPPKSDIFVLLLSVALGAMVLGSLFLLLHWNSYGFDTGGPA